MPSTAFRTGSGGVREREKIGGRGKRTGLSSVEGILDLGKEVLGSSGRTLGIRDEMRLLVREPLGTRQV
jgi:hypothetical protein